MLVRNPVLDRPMQIRRCVKSEQPSLYRNTRRPRSLGAWESPTSASLSHSHGARRDSKVTAAKMADPTGRQIVASRRRNRCVNARSHLFFNDLDSLSVSSSFGSPSLVRTSGFEPPLVRRAAPAQEALQISSQFFKRLHLARPNDQDAPSLISQRLNCSLVPLDVRGEFLLPILDVRFWLGGVFAPGMAMPITPVYEYGLVFCMQDDVGSARQLVDVRLEIVSQRRQTTLHRSFWSGILPPYGGHPSTGLWRCIHGPFIHSRDEGAISSRPPKPTRWLSRAASLGLQGRGKRALQASFPIRWKTMRQVQSRNPIVAEPHPRSNAPISDAARHPLCARRIENHPGTLEDEPPREASVLGRALDA